MSTADSYILDGPEAATSNDDEIDSLPSSVASSDFLEDDIEEEEAEESDAQKEWEASLQQLELMMTMVIVPWVGKYFGRKMAYWSWAKWMTWMYPVEVRYTNKTAFKTAGVVETAATL